MKSKYELAKEIIATARRMTGSMELVALLGVSQLDIVEDALETAWEEIEFLRQRDRPANIITSIGEKFMTSAAGVEVIVNGRG